MSAAIPNVGSYRDRHGKVHWRYRRNGKAFALAVGPEHPDFAVLKRAEDGSAMRRIDVRNQFAFHNYFKKSIVRARDRAKRKNVPFNIDDQIIEQTIRQQDWRCAVSGIKLTPHDAAVEEAFRPSIDRIEPRLGYVPGNIRIVCQIVNLAMHDWGSAPLFKLASALKKQAANRLANLSG